MRDLFYRLEIQSVGKFKDLTLYVCLQIADAGEFADPPRNVKYVQK